MKAEGRDGTLDVCGADSAILGTYELKAYRALVKVSDESHLVDRLLIRFFTGRCHL